MTGTDALVVISGARWKSAARLSGCLAIVLVGIWLASGGYQPVRYDPVIARGGGFLCCLLFTWLGYGNLRSLIRPPRLLLTSEGFQVIGKRSKLDVKWTEVDSFEIAQISYSRFAAFKLRPEAQRVEDQALTQMAAPGFDGLIMVFPSYGPQRMVEILSEWLGRYGTVPQNPP